MMSGTTLAVILYPLSEMTPGSEGIAQGNVNKAQVNVNFASMIARDIIT
jgi:hypothetical protein